MLLLAGPLGCGSGRGGQFAGEVGTYDADAGLSLQASDAAVGVLEAAIDDTNHVAVKVVAVGCAGGCVDVEAVAAGGQAPYSFVWSDGTAGAKRTLCPRADAVYSVKVTDAGATGEVARPPQTASASVTADVLTCPDGGGADAGGATCVSNPSFEGTAAINAVNAPPWVQCPGPGGALFGGSSIYDSTTPGIGTSSPTLAPTDGQTYLVLETNDVNGPSMVLGDQTASEPLCAPLKAGVAYALRMDLSAAPNSASFTGTASAQLIPGSLQIWAGTSSCSEQDLLWTSPPLPVQPGWSTYCAALVPPRDATYLTLAPSIDTTDASALIGTVAVDHLVPVAACP